jgi:hypothetical protein
MQSAAVPPSASPAERKLQWKSPNHQVPTTIMYPNRVRAAAEADMACMATSSCVWLSLVSAILFSMTQVVRNWVVRPQTPGLQLQSHEKETKSIYRQSQVASLCEYSANHLRAREEGNILAGPILLPILDRTSIYRIQHLLSKASLAALNLCKDEAMPALQERRMPTLR